MSHTREASRSGMAAARTLRRRLPAWPVLLLAGWAFGADAAAAEAPLLVKAMLDKAPEAAERRCSYTRTRIEDGNSKRERYDATDPEEPWKLVRVNGREPTAAELRRYARKADDRDRQHPLDFDLREMVDPDHWEVLSETPTEAVFRFRLRPNEDLDERLVEKVRGTLVVDKERLQPVRITIENTEPAYVAPLVRIADYSQELRFEWDETIGAAVLTERETEVRGRALGLRPLREHKIIRYTEYSCGAKVADAG